jgi:prepilin-type processing-associated H-X9-DG protein
LLVVIAIIAILAAILFPVFAQAREKARGISCVSNMKQQVLGMLQYSQDYDEHFPLGHPASPDPVNEFGEPAFDQSQVSVLDPYIKNQGVWRCPSDPAPMLMPSEEDPSVLAFHASYCVNGWFEYGGSLAQVDRPAEKTWMVERAITGDDHFHWWLIGRTQSSDPVPTWQQIINNPNLKAELDSQVAYRRHSEGANYSYIDGHVKWGRMDQLWSNLREKSIFWP